MSTNLSRGLLSASPIGAGDARAHMPRFSGANREANAKLVTGLQGLAKRWEITQSQLAIGWVLSRQPRFMPTLGMRTLQQVDEALAAKPLTAEQLAEVEAIDQTYLPGRRAELQSEQVAPSRHDAGTAFRLGRQGRTPTQ